MLKIVQAPERVLSQKAKPVTIIDKAITNLLKEMDVSLAKASDPEGVGLAAPQVGKSLQIFVVRQTPRSPLLTFINPHIDSFFKKKVTEPQSEQTDKTKKKSGSGVQLEGCLSLKDVWGVVKRHYGVVVSYQDETGKKHTRKFEGFMATIVQHEMDHLQGFLFTKRVLEQKQKLYHSSKNKDGETEFEEITL
jgi:peptide deformylase